MYQFSENSIIHLESCHQDLQKIAREALAVSCVDFGISQGRRSIVEQRQLYQIGRTLPGEIVTHVDGITNKSKHNHYPSLAFDYYAFANGAATWDKKHMIYIGGVITAIAKKLLNEGIVTHKVRWGGNWDNDGVIISDQKFIDLPHIELI